MERYVIKKDETGYDIPHDPWYMTTGYIYSVKDVLTFKTILKTRNKEYAEYVCAYWNEHKRSDNE